MLTNTVVSENLDIYYTPSQTFSSCR